jgi:NitT/TauT family transport system substrate-binding protein
MVILIVGFAFYAQAADKVTIQLKWVTQAQFAGYYVAQDKGYYQAEGLDVTIKPGGPDIATPQVIAGGGADVIAGAALKQIGKGVELNLKRFLTVKQEGLIL